MNNIRAIRDHLGVTQSAMAEAMECTPGNVGHYEKGQTVPPEAARRLIAYAKTMGCEISFDHIYGDAESEQVPGKKASVAVERETQQLVTVQAEQTPPTLLTTNPAMQAELNKAVKAGLVVLPKAVAPWNGVEQRHYVRRAEDRKRLGLDIGSAGQGV